MVKVPVLSTQSTVAEPMACMACECLVKTFLREIRQAPRARKMVSTTGISSGRMAIASVMPARNPLSQSSLVKPYTNTTAAQRKSPISARFLTNALLSL